MPGRWPFFASSEWNRAIRQRRVTIVPMAGMGHTGRGGYIDFKPSDGGQIPNGHDYGTNDCRYHHACRRRSPHRRLAHDACCHLSRLRRQHKSQSRLENKTGHLSPNNGIAAYLTLRRPLSYDKIQNRILTFGAG